MTRLPISVLDLDPANPRLPAEFAADSKTQREIAIYINKHYDPLRIAESIADHEFFESEPLIAVAKGARYTVIEGNRRLCALLGLSSSELRAEFAAENRGWSKISEGSGPAEVPVYVVDDPSAVAPLLGFRHISGIEPWDPYAQARYIAQLVDHDHHTLDEVADLVGRPRTEVASKYRDFDILGQADTLGIDTVRARGAFGVFNNAMGRRAIRAFIGAPDPRSVDPEAWPLPDESRERLATLLELIFGGPGGRGRVITDSRQLAQLAQVIAQPDERALQVLLATRDLEEAVDASSDPQEQFARSLKRAKKELEKAIKLVPDGDLPTAAQGILRRIGELSDEILAGNSRRSPRS